MLITQIISTFKFYVIKINGHCNLIITNAGIVNPWNRLCTHTDFTLCPQNNASKLLLAIMESRHDSENAERILFNMRPRELVRKLLEAVLWTLAWKDTWMGCQSFVGSPSMEQGARSFHYKCPEGPAMAHVCESCVLWLCSLLYTLDTALNQLFYAKCVFYLPQSMLVLVS